MNSKVDEPFQYGYYEGWEIIISSFELLMFALLAVCIVIAPVFSGEYEAGTDAVILSAKYGKTKLTMAKIMASYLFGVLAFTLHVIVALGLPLAAFGFDGWDLSLQIVNTTIPYPWTFLQAVLVNLGVVYLVLFAMLGLTLLLSAKMKSPYLVLIVLVPVLFIPLFLSQRDNRRIQSNLVPASVPFYHAGAWEICYLSNWWTCLRRIYHEGNPVCTIDCGYATLQDLYLRNIKSHKEGR